MTGSPERRDQGVSLHRRYGLHGCIVPIKLNPLNYALMQEVPSILQRNQANKSSIYRQTSQDDAPYALVE
ncbi:hypothetical protein PoB_004890300, partial [Plakobranchus ocellatus]